MGTYKMSLDDAFGYDFTLIAIHGSMEPYYLAFLINKSLNARLVRTGEDLSITQNGHIASFPHYEYIDEKEYVEYHLFANKARVEELVNQSGLFLEEKRTKTVHFLPQLPQIDYYIKVVENGFSFAKAKTIKSLNQIPQIVTAYNLEIDQLKNKENLIF